MALYHQDINDFCQKCDQKIRRYCVQSALFSAGATLCLLATSASALYATKSCPLVAIAANCLSEQGQIRILPVDAGENVNKTDRTFAALATLQGDH